MANSFRNLATTGAALLGLAISILAGPVGCNEREPDRVCATMRERLDQCRGDELPRSAVRSMLGQCQAAMSYTPSPGDAPDNFAARLKATFVRCAAQEQCQPFLHCLDQSGCRWLLSGPSDRSPTFDCLATPPRP